MDLTLYDTRDGDETRITNAPGATLEEAVKALCEKRGWYFSHFDSELGSCYFMKLRPDQVTDEIKAEIARETDNAGGSFDLRGLWEAYETDDDVEDFEDDEDDDEDDDD